MYSAMLLIEPLLKKMEGFNSLVNLDVKSSVIFEEGFLVSSILKASKPLKNVVI